MKTMENTIKVNDIFSSSWGYNSTGVTFYKVISVTAKMVTFVEIGQEGDLEGADHGTTMPVADEVVGKPMRRKVDFFTGAPSFSPNDCEVATKWDGSAKRFSYA
jgi:hypothetical protein